MRDAMLHVTMPHATSLRCTVCTLSIGVLVMLASGTAVSAQSLAEQCSTLPGPEFCARLVDAAYTLPARATIAATAGSPVPGAASTLGMRVPGSPRWSVALRTSAARATVPRSPTTADRPTFWSINADAGVAVFNGLTLMPTVGGFGSVDVLASVGAMSLRGPGSYNSSSATWALGARVGILRESFTAPGLSVSAMYRSLPEVTGPESELATDQSVLSFRGTIGKRVIGMGLGGGIGYDRTTSDLNIEWGIPAPMTPPVFTLEEEDVTTSRLSIFGNVSYTRMILNMAAEVGWQQNGDVPAGGSSDAGKGGLFGSLSIRLAI